MREDILSLLSGTKIDSAPAFSGLIHVTAEGLADEGLVFHEVHHDAQKMAKAAASMFHLTGMPSAALPLDLCAPAEALGTELNFFEDGEFRFPQVRKSRFSSTREIVIENSPILSKGRFKIICDAIELVKSDIGSDVVISGTIPGPYTLLLYLCDPTSLFTEMKKEHQIVLEALFQLSSFLSELSSAYRNAGADFITIHEMGGSPGFIGPAKFEQFVFPAVRKLISDLPKPTVLSICGNANRSLHLLNGTGATAISIDQTSDVHAARETLKATLLFGNIDPITTLSQGGQADIEEAVRGAKEAGVDAVWPGCDLVPLTPSQNIKSLLANDQK